jgi:23S rRNA pseudouridine2605 synthase
MDFVPGNLTGMQMYPVGRLDRNSTGLILLTNDGDLADPLSHPRFEHEKNMW